MKKARELLKYFKGEQDEFLSRLLRTKRDSNNSYMKMMEEVENLKAPKNNNSKHSWSLSLFKNPSNEVLLNSITLYHENAQKLP